ncbi:MAG: helix-turn-helix domain-containing protein [Flavobacteriales bacterium]|nr:helix-turn-helix domain-containing protein [Flavobacteriales bacterium]
MSIGERIKERRVALRLTQAQLAGLANTSVTVICRIERDNRLPDVELLGRLAPALKTSAGWLLDGTENALPTSVDTSLAERVERLDRRLLQLENEMSAWQKVNLYLQSLIDRTLPGLR